MAYCTVEEVIAMFKDDMLNNIIGGEYIEDVTERKIAISTLVETAISDADGEIDGYLAKRYSVPFQNVPKVLNKFSKDIAAYNLASHSGIDEEEREKTYLTRYNAAIAFLVNVAKGTIEIGSNNIKTSASNGFKMESAKRTFSRESMRGW